MSLIVDIRKYHSDNLINDLVNSSKIKKNWWGTKTDNYWEFLEGNCDSINADLNAHLIADFFVYIIDELKYTEVLNKYTSVISTNRNSFVTLLVPEDRDFLLNTISQETFFQTFEDFAKELNSEFYEYSESIIKENIKTLQLVLRKITVDHGVLINVC